MAFDALVEARLPAKPATRPDPLLDRLYVDVLAESGQLQATLPVLQRVVADPATPNRSHYRQLLAAYSETIGEFSQAEGQYKALSTDPKAGAGDRLAAVLGLVRMQMTTDPAAALATLDAQDPRSVSRSAVWELDLYRARAAAMGGPATSALVAPALDKAWSEAAYAALGDAAAAQVAGDRAAAAGRAGDRSTIVSMLAVDRYDRAANSGKAGLVADLPLCGANGIGPQDRVVVDVTRLPPAGRPGITLVWASRPGIARPFLAAAERSGELSVESGQAAMFALSCRTAPATDYAVRNTLEERIAGWMTSQGAYPLSNRDDAADPATIASMLAQREARYGSTSVMLLPVLLRNMSLTTGGIFGDQDARKRASAAVDRMGTILVANHAPADLLILSQMASIGMSVMAQTRTPAAGQSEIQALLLQAANSPDLTLDMIYTLTVGSTRLPNVPSSFQQAMLGATLDLLKRKAPPGDQRTSAIALRLYNIRKSLGDNAGAMAALQPLGLPGDLCALSDPPVHMVSSDIRPEDYPADLVFTAMPGLTGMEFDLDPLGNARNGRVILSDPPYAFDDIALARVATIHYEPARIGGNGPACRGVTQAVRWQLPY